MALYRPDYKLREAQQVIDDLSDSKKNLLIKYFINNKQEVIDKQKKKIKEYDDWFEKLNGFLPHLKHIKF